jgi:lysozyme
VTPAALNAVIAQIKFDEGFRSHVYDDATGALVLATGTPTIGYGCACVFWSVGLATVVLIYQVNQAITEVLGAIAWSGKLDDARFGVLVQLTFNLGIHGLLEFTQMLDHLRDQQWAAASLQLKASAADHQEPARVARWAQTLATGVAWMPAAA